MASLGDMTGLTFPLGGNYDSISSGPVIEEVTPAVATVIRRTTVIDFTVVDVVPFARIILSMRQGPSGPEELVYDGERFGPTFEGPSNQALNTPLGVTAGFRFRLLRDGAWVGTFRIAIIAINSAGEELATTLFWLVRS